MVFAPSRCVKFSFKAPGFGPQDFHRKNWDPIFVGSLGTQQFFWIHHKKHLFVWFLGEKKPDFKVQMSCFFCLWFIFCYWMLFHFVCFFQLFLVLFLSPISSYLVLFCCTFDYFHSFTCRHVFSMFVFLFCYFFLLDHIPISICLYTVFIWCFEIFLTFLNGVFLRPMSLIDVFPTVFPTSLFFRIAVFL